MFCAFWLENALIATAGCHFSFLGWTATSAPATLASLLFEHPEPRIIWRVCIFFLVTLLACWSSFFWLDFFTLVFNCPHCQKEVRLLTFLRLELWRPQPSRYWKHKKIKLPKKQIKKTPQKNKNHKITKNDNPTQKARKQEKQGSGETLKKRFFCVFFSVFFDVFVFFLCLVGFFFFSGSLISFLSLFLFFLVFFLFCFLFFWSAFLFVFSINLFANAQKLLERTSSD